jgi:hypothetical protein
MADKKAKLPTFTSPRGVARYPHLNAPDTKFNKAGVYRVDLLLKGADAETLIEKFNTAYGEAVAKAAAENKGKKIKKADVPYSAVTDDEGNETGETKFSFKMTASGVRKDGTPWQRRPTIFDAKGQPVKDAKIGGGSEIKVAYSLMPFYTAAVGAGISLRLEAVQVLKLVEWGGRDAKGYGFSSEEEGYDASEAAEAGEASSADETGTADTADASDEKDF